MQSLISTRAIRLSHQLRRTLAEMSYAQRRMFELRTGISSRSQRERRPSTREPTS